MVWFYIYTYAKCGWKKYHRKEKGRMKKTKEWKMRRVKRCMAGLMAMVLVLAGVPMYVGMEAKAATATSGDYEYEVNEDGNSVTITKYNGGGGDVVIPSEIEEKKVTGIGAMAFSGCRSLVSVIIPEGVTKVEKSAFSWCRSLISVAIPEGVSCIEAGTFSECSNLTDVMVPEGVTSIGSYTF